MALPNGFLEAALPLLEGSATKLSELAGDDMVFLRCVTGPDTNPLGTQMAARVWPGWRLYGGPLRMDQVQGASDMLFSMAFQAKRSIFVEAVPLVPFKLWPPPHTHFRWYPWVYEHERPARWRIAQVYPKLVWQKIV